MTRVFRDHFSSVRNDDRRGYARFGPVLELVSSTKGLDALMKALVVAGSPAQLKRLSDDDKAKEILRRIEQLIDSPTSIWHRAKAGEVLVGHIYQSSLSDRVVMRELFGEVRKESDLLLPVAKYMVDLGWEVFAEVPLGRNRADLLGTKKAGWLSAAKSLAAVELKNDLAQMKRGVDQMTTYSDYAGTVYMACTPALANEYLWWHADSAAVKKWDPDVLERKLAKIGCGLLLVENDRVFLIQDSRTHRVPQSNTEEVLPLLTEKRKVRF